MSTPICTLVRVGVLQPREGCGERAPGDLHDLESAHDVDDRCRRGSARRPPGRPRPAAVQHRRPDLFHLAPPVASAPRRRCPANSNRSSPARVYAPTRRRERAPSPEHAGRRWRTAPTAGRARRSATRYVEQIDQVVRDAPPLGDRQLRRTDVHAAVDGHRVAVHDLAAERLGQVEREVALARGRRADDGDDRGRGMRKVFQDTDSPPGAVEDPARPGFGGGKGVIADMTTTPDPTEPLPPGDPVIARPGRGPLQPAGRTDPERPEPRASEPRHRPVG